MLVPLAYSSSEPWVRKMQIPAHSKGNSAMKEGEWNGLTLWGYCWEQDEPTEKIVILYWNCGTLDQGLQRTLNSLIQASLLRPLLYFLCGLQQQASTIHFHPSLPVQALVCRCLHLPPLCQLAGVTLQKDARWYFSQPDFQITGFCSYLFN